MVDRAHPQNDLANATQVEFNSTQPSARRHLQPRDALNIPYDQRVRSFRGGEVTTAADVAGRAAESVLNSFDITFGSAEHHAIIEAILRGIHGFVSGADRIETPQLPQRPDSQEVRTLIYDPHSSGIVVDRMDRESGRQMVEDLIANRGEQ